MNSARVLIVFFVNSDNKFLGGLRAEWLRPLSFNALNPIRLTAVGSSLARSYVRQAKFCLRVVRWFFLAVAKFLNYCPPPFRRKAEGHCFRLSVVRSAWFWIFSRYLVPSTPPTVFGQSFWNFTGAFAMVWRFACGFFRILKLFFITFFAFLT